MKITCVTMRRIMWSYLDGEVEEELRAEVEIHLTECGGNCRCYCNTLRGTLDLCRQLPELDVPEQLARVLEEIWKE